MVKLFVGPKFWGPSKHDRFHFRDLLGKVTTLYYNELEMVPLADSVLRVGQGAERRSSKF